jgi:hypothetical protein
VNRWLKLVLAANLIGLAVLAFVFPHLMVGPGKLIPAHQKLETDCFACHTAFNGVTAERCTACHKAEDIGSLTTAGLPVSRPATSTPFHQKLVRQDCVACHSDHEGVRRFRQQRRFDHSLLQADSGNQCEACHKSPSDPLHQRISGSCGKCHTQDKWKPATFEHDKLFQLDSDHNVKCITCHVNNDYNRYTCYGCHEHTPDNIRRKHTKEGISSFENCVECHRSADEHDIRMPGRGGDGGERRRRND